MPHWLFQGNPDRFDIDGYLSTHNPIRWTVNQQHYADQMAKGQEVFFWRAEGRAGAIPGVVASGLISRGPEVMPEDAPELWKEEPREALRVEVRLNQVNVTPRKVVRKDWLESDPVFQDHQILDMPRMTNYSLTPGQADRLRVLLLRTGSPWTLEESLAGLWAYKETRGGSVSRSGRPESPVTVVSLAIGRTLTGVYNKVMNFRALDPTDPRTGFSGVGQADRDVWDDYFDAATGTLDEDRLDRDFHRQWRTNLGPTRRTYRDFGAAPPDDPDELQTFARRVRRGQKAFRDRLLDLYGASCAVTGHGPEPVLEACHLAPHSETGSNDPDNGLLLRSDIHALFDEGLLSIEPKTLTIHVAPELEGTPYAELEGKALRQRKDDGQPAEEALRVRWRSREN